MLARVEYSKTTKGKTTVRYRGFEYYHHKDNNDSVTWRCRQYKSKNCRAFISTSGDRVVSNRQPEHTHVPDNLSMKARSAMLVMKEEMSGVGATPTTVVGRVCRDLSNACLMRLPKKPTIQRTLQRNRNQHVAALGPPPTTTNFPIPEKFRAGLLHDSGRKDPERLLMFGTRELLDGLARAEVWLADGTFKVVPALFFQLYTIHFHFGEGRNPAAVYCLLRNKTRQSYNKMLAALKDLIPQGAPHVILVDFESATISALQEAFPDSTIKALSYFTFNCTQHALRLLNLVISFRLLLSFVSERHKESQRIGHEECDGKRSGIQRQCALLAGACACSAGFGGRGFRITCRKHASTRAYGRAAVVLRAYVH